MAWNNWTTGTPTRKWHVVLQVTVDQSPLWRVEHWITRGPVGRERADEPAQTAMGAQDLAEARRNTRRFLKRVAGRYGIQVQVIDHGLKADRLIEQLRSAMDLLEFRTLHREGRTTSSWLGAAGPFADIDREERGDNGRAG